MSKLQAKGCSNCGGKNHTSLNCFQKPRKQLKKTPLKKRGKHAKKWASARSELLKEKDEWHCLVGGALLTRRTVTFDHDKARTRDPKLRYVKSNYNNPMCLFHNCAKGSRGIKEYLASNPDMRCRNTKF